MKHLPFFPKPLSLRYAAGISICSLLSATAFAAPTISVPGEVPLGAKVKIEVADNDTSKPFVTIVEPNANEGSYGRKVVIKKENETASLAAPETPGNYEVRLLSSESGRPTLASAPLVVTPVQVTINAPETIEAGSPIDFTWSGPDNEREFITIVDADAKEGTYKKYIYASKAKRKGTGSLTAPEAPGNYEIRYLSANQRFTLGSAALTVEAASAELTAVDSIEAGSPIEITWEGPDNERDFITIVKASAAEGTYEQYKYPSKFQRQKKIELLAPEQAGDYEIRYVTGSSRYTLASRPLKVLGVEVTLTAPASAEGGEEIEISWQGMGNKNDFITIVPKDADEGVYKKYQYVKKYLKTSTMKLSAPDLPGEYEVRYLSAKKRYTLASAPLTVGGTEATLTAPRTAPAGSELTIDWEGPDNKGDFITLVAADAEEGTYDKYVYTKKKYGPRKLNRITLPVPDLAGQYEIRYVTGGSKLTIGSSPLEVVATEASVTAPAEVVAGSSFEIDWTGPDNKRDFITIVEADAEETKYGKYQRVSKRFGPRKLQKAVLFAPEETGDYQVRYLTGGKYLTLASTDVKVVPPSATVKAAESQEVGKRLSVTWTGPEGQGDYIAILKVDADTSTPETLKDATLSSRYTTNGNPASVPSPKEAGKYQVAYVTGKKRLVLATQQVEFTPSTTPGKLKVTASELALLAAQKSQNGAVGLILDASGSMLKREAGKRRIDIAKEALNSLVNSSIPEGSPFALRVFGHKETDSCRTDLEIPFGPLNKPEVTSKVSQVQAMNYAKTPLGASLELIQQDMEGVEGKRTIILLTDGEETCDGDPAAAIDALVRAGFDTRVNIVGFAIEDASLRDTFEEWARIGNGTYFDAKDSASLTKSMKSALDLPYEVVDASGSVQGEGTLGGASLSLLPGKYELRLKGSDSAFATDVEVAPKKTTTITFQE